jgi:predicted nucleic acid-binding protein
LDTGPINYLIQIGQIELLPLLFERVAIPAAVQGELCHPGAPVIVQHWIANPPGWLEIIETQILNSIPGLHNGEAAALALAASLQARLLIMDERIGTREAKRRGLRVTGTLGVLDAAAERGMVDFAKAIQALKGTTFRLPAIVLEALLAKHRPHRM